MTNKIKPTVKKEIIKPTKSGEQIVFEKAMELGKKLLLENQPRISKKLDKEISELENNPNFLALIGKQKQVVKYQNPRLQIVIDNGCDVVFGDAVTGKLYALENHFGSYSLKLLKVPLQI